MICLWVRQWYLPHVFRKTITRIPWAIRSSLQDVKFYINGTLRASYNTSETRLAGKNSASRYIFCETSEADAGKELRIELTTHTYNYSGVVNTVLCGDKTDIWLTILNQYGPATYIAIFIFLPVW